MTRRSSLVHQLEALAAKRGVQPLRITLDGKSKVTLYAAPRADERDDRVFPHMWVHRLRIVRNEHVVSVMSDTWEALPEASATETTLHEWPGAGNWAGLKPPVSFETKQRLFQNQPRSFRDWTDEAWSEKKVRQKFEIWKSIRDGELHNMALLKRNPERIVNPTELRIVGFVYASRADDGKDRIAQIFLELNIVTAVYDLAAGDFKEQVLEEYARPYKTECQASRKEDVRQGLGFRLSFVGTGVEDVIGTARMHGPPLNSEELRSTLQNQLEHFRQSRVEKHESRTPETELSVYLVPAIRRRSGIWQA